MVRFDRSRENGTSSRSSPITGNDHLDGDHRDRQASHDWLWPVRKARLISWSNRTRDPFSWSL